MRGTRALVVLLTAAACSSCALDNSGSGGPLSFGGAGGDLCLPAGTGSEYTYGVDAVSSTTPMPITIDRVRLVGAHGLALKEALLTPVANMTLVGAQPAWPPPGALGTDTWSARVPAVGATIHRVDGDRNLVLHLSTAGPRSGFAATRIDYRVGGRRFSKQTSITFRIEPTC
jgi:hypothetical protein